MKAGLLIAALSAVAIAQPHVRHQQLHEEKRDVVVTQYETDVVTATAQGPVVYVDQFGNKISEAAAATPSPEAKQPDTKQNWAPQQHDHPGPQAQSSTTQAAAPPPAATSQAPVVPAAPPAAVSSVAAAVPAPPAPAKSSAAAEAPSSSPQQGSTGGGIGSGVGITYSPYAASGCKSDATIKSDLAKLSKYSSIRVYNTDCNCVSSILAQTGATVMIGINNEKIHDVSGQVSAISAQVGNNWSRVEAVAVGNEGVNGGVYDVGTISAQVGAFKSAFQGANINTKVITVDTAVAIVANKALCKVGDFVGANSHAFWNGAIPASGAGPFVKQSMDDVVAACGGRVVITESGWPNAGPAFKSSIASTANTAAAVSSLEGSFKNNLYLFNAFNTPNVQDPAQKDWGIYSDN